MSCSRSCSTVRSRRSREIGERHLREDDPPPSTGLRRRDSGGGEREGPLGSDQETGAGGKEKTGRRTLTKSAQKHGKNGQKSLTKNAETYINVRVQCKGPSGRLCPRVLK